MQNPNMAVKDLVALVQETQDTFLDKVKPPDKSPIACHIKRPLVQTISLHVNRNSGEISCHFNTTVESFFPL